MARPKKQGMDYFPHDVDARNDLKLRKLRAVYGNDGYAFYFIMLENIYKTKNYELEVSDAETKLILAEEVKVTEERFSEILNKCLDLGLFNKTLFEEHQIITSEAIKIRTEPVESKRVRNKSSYESKKDINNEVSAEISAGVSEAETMSESTQSKVKESKVKESKVKERKEENFLHEKAIELCMYYSELKPMQSITQDLPALKIFLEDYSFDWCKEALQKTVIGTGKFVPNYMKKILKDWAAEGKEEQKGVKLKNGDAERSAKELEAEGFGFSV